MQQHWTNDNCRKDVDSAVKGCGIETGGSAVAVSRGRVLNLGEPEVEQERERERERERESMLRP